jgi:AsmA protein
MRKILRLFLFATGGLIALAIMLTLFSWAFVDSDLIKNHIEETASQAMEMDLKIDGPVRILLFPSPVLRLRDIHIRNGETEWFSAFGLNVRIRILALLQGRVEVVRIDFVRPNLQLKPIVQGGFDFIPLSSKEVSSEGRFFDLRGLRVRDANINFTDAESGERFEAQGCDLTVRHLEWGSAGSYLSELRLPNFQSHLSCRVISYDMMELTELEAQVFVQDQRIKISSVNGQLFGGQLGGEGESDLSGASPTHFFEMQLADFRVERFIKTFQEKKGAEGLLNFTAQLSFSGKTTSEMIASLDGWAELSGSELVLYGLDLDEQLARYETTQTFNLVDVAAFFVAGPGGLVVTRGYGFASLFADTDEQTPIRKLISKWDIENGIARASDVALSTAENRLALAGSLDFVNLEFKDTRVALVDPEGCAVVEQRIHGKFQDPEIEKPHFLITLVAPLIDIVERGVGLFWGIECEPFYTGELGPP